MKTFAAFLLLCTAPAASFGQPSGQAAPAAFNTQGSQAADAGSKPAAIDPAKNAAIHRLFDVMGTKDAMRQVVAGMTEKMRPMLESSLPAGEYRGQLIDLFLKKFMSKLSVDEMVELAIPVYDKYFSMEDLDDLTRFYQTPLGKKAISVLPQVLIETQSAGMRLGEQIGRDSMTEVLNEHPDLKKALQDAAAPKN